MKTKKNLLKIATIGLATTGLVATPIVLTSCSKNENNPVDPTPLDQPTIESDKYAVGFAFTSGQLTDTYVYGTDEYEVSIGSNNTISLYVELWDKEQHSLEYIPGMVADHDQIQAKFLNVQTDIPGLQLPETLSHMYETVSLENIDASWVGKSLTFYLELYNSPSKSLGDFEKLAQVFTFNFVA